MGTEINPLKSSAIGAASFSSMQKPAQIASPVHLRPPTATDIPLSIAITIRVHIHFGMRTAPSEAGASFRDEDSQAQSVPSLEAITTLIDVLQESSSEYHLAVAIFMLERALRETDCTLRSDNWECLFLSAFIVASKLQDDIPIGFDVLQRLSASAACDKVVSGSGLHGAASGPPRGMVPASRLLSRPSGRQKEARKASDPARSRNFGISQNVSLGRFPNMAGRQRGAARLTRTAGARARALLVGAAVRGRAGVHEAPRVRHITPPAPPPSPAPSARFCLPRLPLLSLWATLLIWQVAHVYPVG